MELSMEQKLWYDFDTLSSRKRRGTREFETPKRWKFFLSERIRFTIIIYDGHCYAKAASAIFYSHSQHKVEGSCKYSQLPQKSETCCKDVIIRRTLFIIVSVILLQNLSVVTGAAT